MKIASRYIAIVFFIIAFFSVKTKAEFGLDSYTIGGGLSVAKIMNDNPATKSLFDSLAYGTFGGSLNGAQSGFEIRATFDLNSDSRFKFPLGFAYYLYDGKERQPLSRYLDVKLEHEVQILTPYIGIQYSFWEMPRVAELYFGVDFATSYIFNSEFTQTIIDKGNLGQNSVRVLNDSTKKYNTTRFGLNTKIGVIGKLEDNLEINVSGGVNFQNLFNKENQRGELFTPRNFLEFKESPINNFIFSLLIQYRF